LPRITKLTSKSDLKNIATEAVLNNTSAVTKVTDNSVLSGIMFGVASLGQKSLAEVAAVESFLFPDTASGTQLDSIASDRGVSDRFTSSGSSTKIKIEADSGTSYVSGTHTFIASNGIVFNLDSNVTIGSLGFDYATVSSSTSGSDTNVEALKINTVSPIPSGHTRCFNEYRATGGRDSESDDLFRKRIKESANILARGTISSLEQAFIKVNNNVLRVLNQGLDSSGNTKLAIVTQNGVDLTTNELGTLLDSAKEFVSLTDIRPFGDDTYGIVLSNIEYEPIDINFRVTLDVGYDADQYRIDVQTKISKYLDFRTFNSEVDKVEWDDLLEIAKNTKGAKYIQDQYFFVNAGRVDVTIPRNELPRVRSFAMYDEEGVVIQNLSGTLSPSFFPNQADLNFQLTALKTI
jgi:hypothetical protein